MSQRWKDNSGREWVARITIATADRLRTAGIDVLDAEKIGGLFADPLSVVSLLVEIHADQAATANITPADFAELVTETEDVSRSAVAALEAALADFFRRLRRPALARVVEQATAAADRVERKTLERMNDPRIAAAMERQADAALANLDAELEAAITGGESGRSPAS